MTSPPAAGVPTIALNTGAAMPQIGLGTAPLTDEEVVPAVVAAIEAGYRSIDTAQAYGNEAGVGEGIRASGVPREELFVTTKLDGRYQGSDRAVEGLEGCLGRLGTDYVDLLLIHWPLPWRDEYVSTWRTFERLFGDGKARAIGVSNFKPSHLDRLLAETDVVPAVNQIELNPGVARSATRAYDARHGIVTESWSPLGAGNDLLGHPVITGIASRYERTPAQVVLRWHVQLGLVAIPRSANTERIRQNLDVFDFALTDEDMQAIAALDAGERAATDSDVAGH